MTLADKAAKRETEAFGAAVLWVQVDRAEVQAPSAGIGVDSGLPMVPAAAAIENAAGTRIVVAATNKTNR